MAISDVNVLLSNAIEAMPLQNFISPIFTHGSLMDHIAFGGVTSAIKEAVKGAQQRYLDVTNRTINGNNENVMQQVLSGCQVLHEYCMAQKQSTSRQVMEGQYLLLKASSEVQTPGHKGTFLLFHCDHSGAMRCSTFHGLPLKHGQQSSDQSGTNHITEDVPCATLAVIENFMAVPAKRCYAPFPPLSSPPPSSQRDKDAGMLHSWVSNSTRVVTVHVISRVNCQCGFIFTVFGPLLFLLCNGAVTFFHVSSGGEELLRAWWISLTQQRQEKFLKSAQDAGTSIIETGAAISLSTGLVALTAGSLVHAIWLAPLLATTGIIGLTLIPVGVTMCVMFSPLIPDTVTLQSASNHPAAHLKPMAPFELPQAFAWSTKAMADRAESFEANISYEMESEEGDPVEQDMQETKNSITEDPSAAAPHLYDKVA